MTIETVEPGDAFVPPAGDWLSTIPSFFGSVTAWYETPTANPCDWMSVEACCFVSPTTSWTDHLRWR